MPAQNTSYLWVDARMVALWGSSKGHAGAGEIFPVQGGTEPMVGNGLSSMQVLVDSWVGARDLDWQIQKATLADTQWTRGGSVAALRR